MRKSTKGAGRKPAPLTSKQKQQRRRAALNEIAIAEGWTSWGEYETAVKHRAVKIAPAHAECKRRNG